LPGNGTVVKDRDASGASADFARRLSVTTAVLAFSIGKLVGNGPRIWLRMLRGHGKHGNQDRAGNRRRTWVIGA